MLMYHCDGKGCDFSSMDENDFVHIEIGCTNNKLAADLATRDLCPGCANRLAIMLLNETVAPVDRDAVAEEQIGDVESLKEKVKETDKIISDFGADIASTMSRLKEKLGDVVYAGDINLLAKAYLEYSFGAKSDGYIFSKYHVLSPVLWTNVSKRQYACDQMLLEICALYRKTKSINAIASAFDLSEETVAGIVESDISANFPDGDLPSKVPMPRLKRMILACSEHRYTTHPMADIVKKYNVTESEVCRPSYVIMSKYTDMETKIALRYVHGDSVEIIAKRYNCPISLTRSIVKGRVDEVSWRGDVTE